MSGKSTFKKAKRIRSNADFERLLRQGRRCSSELFNFYYLSNDAGFARLGLPVGKRLGNSSKRNQIKRVLRELFRRNQSLLPAVDLLVAPRRGVDFQKLDFKTADLDFAKLCEKVSVRSGGS